MLARFVRSDPWKEEDHIRDACGLVGEREVDYLVENAIFPLLAEHGEQQQNRCPLCVMNVPHHAEQNKLHDQDHADQNDQVLL